MVKSVKALLFLVEIPRFRGLPVLWAARRARRARRRLGAACLAAGSEVDAMGQAKALVDENG